MNDPLAHLSDTAKHWLDAGAIGGAIIAGVSLAQTALLVSIFAGLASLVLACLRIYDWFNARKVAD